MLPEEGFSCWSIITSDANVRGESWVEVKWNSYLIVNHDRFIEGSTLYENKKKHWIVSIDEFYRQTFLGAINDF